MSGLEIAGLVFGAFPLIISAMEHGRTVAKAGRLHRRIREEYNNCRSDIKFHQTWYQRNLKALLQTIVQDADVVRELLQDPGGSRWQDDNDNLQSLLEGRLQDSYDVYMNIMRRMNEAVGDLKDELCVDEATIQSQLITTKTATTTGTTTTTSTFTLIKSKWDYNAFRIKFSLGDASRQELFGKLQDCNDKLEKLLSLVDEPPAPVKSSSPLEAIFKVTRKKSELLYKALKAAWRCRCQQDHSANLRLEHRTAADINFEIILASAAASSGTSGWEWAAVRCKQLKTCPCGTRAAKKPALPPTPTPTPPLTPAGSTLSGTKQKKRVSIQPSPGIQPPMHDLVVEDPLCERLAGHKGDACLGTVGCEDERYHLHPLPPQQSKDAITLSDILSQSANAMSRRQRYLIALMLASSVVQLGHTQWLRSGITKEKVLFFQENQSPSLKEPFIQQGFPTNPVGSSNANFFELLGITLLELCFGERLEDNPSRKRFPAGTGDTKLAFDLVAAMEWRKKVEEEGGPDYATAVQWCFNANQANDAWHGDLVKNVVVPLEKCQQYFRAAAAC